MGAARLLLLPFASAAPLGIFERNRLHLLEDAETPISAGDPNLWIYLAVAVALVLLGGVFAGLTIALMGQDVTYLQVIANSGEGSERKHASKVLNLLSKGKHWVLVTLLLSNVITNETLPIVLDRSLGGGWPAVVSSTVLIGEFELMRSWTDHADKLTTSHFRRSCASIRLCALRPPHWRSHGSLRLTTDVDHVSHRLADREAS